jgi:WXG100 family type VII secretion target
MNDNTGRVGGMASSNMDFATLHQAASDVRSVKSEVDGELRKLDGQVSEMGGAWKGAAATAFQQLHQQWSQDTNKLLQALQGIADLLDKSGNLHQSNDEQQQQSMNSILSTLNPT